MKRKVLIALVGTFLLIGVLVAIGWQVRSRMSAQMPLRSATVQRGSIRVAVTGSGTIVPVQRVGLAFETPGRVAEVAVAVGDRVKAGQVLARLDTRGLEFQVQQAEAGLIAAEAQLEQLRAGAGPEEIAAAEADLRAAEARVAAAAANRDQLRNSVTPAQIAAAEAQVASAQLQERQAQQEYDRVFESTGDPERREQAAYRLLAARKQLEAAQARLENLLAGADSNSLQASQANLAVAIAQRDVAQARLDLLRAGATPAQIAAAQAQVNQARVALKLARLALDRATLRAPFDGEVAVVNVREGEAASTGVPAIVLLDTSRFRLTISVDELEIGRLAVGQPAQITLDAFPGEVLTGTVERIAPTARTEGGVVYYDVTIALEGGELPLRADMTATATILVQELQDVLKIPTWIVRVDRLTGQTYVHRRTERGAFERADVTLGIRYEGEVQVLDGLTEGETIYWVEESGGLFGLGARGQ